MVHAKGVARQLLGSSPDGYAKTCSMRSITGLVYRAEPHMNGPGIYAARARSRCSRDQRVSTSRQHEDDDPGRIGNAVGLA